MQSKSDKNNVTVMRVDKDAGHGAGKSTEKVISGIADTFAFIEKAVGPVNQDEYKKINIFNF